MFFTHPESAFSTQNLSPPKLEVSPPWVLPHQKPTLSEAFHVAKLDTFDPDKTFLIMVSEFVRNDDDTEPKRLLSG